MKLTTEICLVERLRISKATYLLPQNTPMMCKGITLPFYLYGKVCIESMCVAFIIILTTGKQWNLQRWHRIVLSELRYSINSPIKDNYLYCRNNSVFTKICHMFLLLRASSGKALQKYTKECRTNIERENLRALLLIFLHWLMKWGWLASTVFRDYILLCNCNLIILVKHKYFYYKSRIVVTVKVVVFDLIIYGITGKMAGMWYSERTFLQFCCLWEKYWTCINEKWNCDVLQRSQHHSVTIVNCFGLDGLCWICGRGEHIFRTTPFRPALGSTQPSVQRIIGDLSIGVILNLLKHETHLSPPYFIVTKNACIISSSCDVHFHGIVLRCRSYCALFFFMISCRNWRISHALSHHLYTNSLLDLELAMFEPLLQWVPHHTKSFVIRYVSWFYSFVIYCILFHSSLAIR
jgi:hypothetical protein